jgi:anti-sigma factor RsiW
MNPCPEKEELVLYVAEELEAERLPAIIAHLATCDVCRREVETLGRGLKALECLEREPAVRPEVLDAIRRRTRRPAIFAFTGTLRWMAAAAAVLLAVGLGWHFAGHRPSIHIQSVATEQKSDALLEMAAAVELLGSNASTQALTADPADPTDPTADDDLNEMNLLLESLSNESGLQG